MVFPALQRVILKTKKISSHGIKKKRNIGKN